MRFPGIKTAKTFSRWVQARILGGALILAYHRISNATRDTYDVCVAPEHFAEQMEVLRKHMHPLPLSKLVDHLKNNSLPPKSVSVTFDDGYADNFYKANPVLEDYQIPATIFVCTGYAGKEFWWDELERLIMSSNADLNELHFQVGKNQIVWQQPKVSLESDLNFRRNFHHSLYHFLLSHNFEKQSQILETVRDWSGISSTEATSRAMTHEEIHLFAKSDLIDLGSHTRHHPMLPCLSKEHQKDEIISGKRDLEELVGKQVKGFAYPNGRATEDAKQIVQELGFSYACTSLQNVVRPDDTAFELTRFWQKDVDGERFLQGLQMWLKC